VIHVRDDSDVSAKRIGDSRGGFFERGHPTSITDGTTSPKIAA
jgi:hypothetical protein